MCNCASIPNPGAVGLPAEALELLTDDLLAAYRNPIACYLTHRLWGQIGATEGELTAALHILEVRPLDPARLVLVQQLVQRILQKGLCL